MKNQLLLNRRQMLETTALAGAALLAPPALIAADAPAPFSLPPLPYALDALEPFIDAQTMGIHHSKHHAAYITNLNKALADKPDLAKQSIEALLKSLSTLPESVRGVVRNHGGGHANHALFWQTLKKNNGAKPGAELGAAIDKRFGSFAKFQEKFSEAATKQFGSGWAWLSLDASKQLVVESTPNQDSPLSIGHTPLLGLDVWEHAYYLKYQNRRPEYIAAFYNVINWDRVSESYLAAAR